MNIEPLYSIEELEQYAAMTPEHVETEQCGFDRSSSLSCDTYVCTCGWPFGVLDKPV